MKKHLALISIGTNKTGMNVSNLDLSGTADGRSHWESKKQVCMQGSIDKGLQEADNIIYLTLKVS